MKKTQFKYDMHCHTHEGSPDSKVNFEEFVGILQEKGFTGMLVTDHDSYNGYKYWSEIMRDLKLYNDFIVIKGIEYDTLDAGHIIVVMPTGFDSAVLEHKGMRLEELIEYVHSNGGILGPAHPCGEPFLSIYRTGKYKKDTDVTCQFDFLEGFNACEYAEDNQEARHIARQYNKPYTGGSDAHWKECVGMGATIFPQKIISEDDLISYIKNEGQTNPDRIKISGQRYFGTLRDKLGTANKVLVYGYWPYNRIGCLLNKKARNKLLNK